MKSKVFSFIPLKTQSLSITIAKPNMEPKIIGQITGPPLIIKVNIYSSWP
jgi:hypothetical protein